MNTFIIRIFDQNMNIINQHRYKGYYMEEAEANARKSCKWFNGHTWDVLWDF